MGEQMPDGYAQPDHLDRPRPAGGRPRRLRRLVPSSSRLQLLLAGVPSLLLALALALAADLDPRLVTTGTVVVLVVTATTLRTVAARRVRAEQAGLVYLLGTRLAAAEEARARHAEIMHELRSTVQGVSSASRLLTERSTELSHEIAGRLESLRQAELSRLERLLAQSGPVRPDEVRIDDVVRPLVDSVELRGHRVHWDPAGLTALGRPDDVAEIVHVLLENAVRHAPGSQNTLAVERTHDRVSVVVSDTGPGVDAALRQRVFDRGVRSVTSVGEGLGLSAALRLARLMGGELRLVEGSATSGATFALDLPAAPHDRCHARSA